MQRTLYLGLNAPAQSHVYHLPIIKIVPRSFECPQIAHALSLMESYTHVIFTSQTAIHLLFQNDLYAKEQLQDKPIIVVGKASALILNQYIKTTAHVAPEATAEGVIILLKEMIDPVKTHIFWPHSALSRPALTDYFVSANIQFTACELYDTVAIELAEKPNLEQFHEIIFTSPSTVDAFLLNFGAIPSNKILTSIGPITQAHLAKFL